ncbi:MAG: glycosyltransferase family 87 protein [Myxococcota bacterium]
MPVSLDRSAKFSILVVFLVLSIASVGYIPFIEPTGIDLFNIVLYQKCAAHSSPYLIDAATCGDPLARGMYYPPLLFHSFIWLRGLSLQAAMRVWVPFSLLALGGIFYVWTRWIARARTDERFWEVPIFCVLIAFQFPFAFALERGQTDVVAMLLFTAGCYCYTRRQLLLTGAFFGLATAYKLYPLFACAIVGLGLLLAQLQQRERPGRDWLRFGVGALAAFALANLVFWRDSKLYFTRVLPEISAIYTPAASWVHGHSFTSLVGANYKPFTWAFCAALIGLWGWATSRAILRDDAAIALAGSLAPSTYFAGYTYDYNLITTYPLLLLVFLRARRLDRWALLGLGVFAMFADRRSFANVDALLFNPTMHIMVQLAFLVAAALAIAEPAPKKA